MATSLPTSDMTVEEILESWPETVPVFQELNTACIGCVMAPFDSMVDVARIYEFELSDLMEVLFRAVQSAEQDGQVGGSTTA